MWRALHHKFKDPTISAYLRTDYFEQRVPVMSAWGEYVSGSLDVESAKDGKAAMAA